jgi:hypothetical protein
VSGGEKFMQSDNERQDYFYTLVIFFLPIFAELLAAWLYKPLLNLDGVFLVLGIGAWFWISFKIMRFLLHREEDQNRQRWLADAERAYDMDDVSILDKWLKKE